MSVSYDRYSWGICILVKFSPKRECLLKGIQSNIGFEHYDDQRTYDTLDNSLDCKSNLLK